MTNGQNIAFLGAGAMASAMIRGVLASGLAPASAIAATDVRPEPLAELSEQLGIRTFDSSQEACAFAGTIVLAVKPQVLPSVLAAITPVLRPDQLLLSIAAGVPCAKIAAGSGGHARIVRAMPNTPLLVGAGATAICRGPGASDADLARSRELFACAGLVVEVDEKLIDAVTGLSGSGPAYAFVAIEALSDAGVRAGLARDVATRLAAQTLLGAAKMVVELGEHPAKLKDQVTSPGGTTIAGVEALEQGGLRHALMAAVAAATRRARELAGLNG